MKNKKIAIFIAAVTALTLAACGNQSAPAPTASPAVSAASTPTPTSAVTPAATPTTEEPTPTADVDYSGDINDWMYAPESDDEPTRLLVTIDTAAHGTAGSSIQNVYAAVSLMKLASDESDNVEEAVSDYLSQMNDTQRDFFSFQWRSALDTATALLDGSKDPAILQDAGDLEFDLNAVDPAAVDGLNETVRKLLDDAGVCDVWKEHADLEPFSASDLSF